MANYGSSSKTLQSAPTGRTEFEILRASHRFLRADDEEKLSWDEQLALKYYNSLFREYAVCDLKHYKSGLLSLRWRTETEVLSGAGETTCGNTRCRHHEAPRSPKCPPPLSTLELPFSYMEKDQAKSALVKVVLCERCCGKLMWKRHQDAARERVEAGEPEVHEVKEEDVDKAIGDVPQTGARPRSSRSLSPIRNQDESSSRRQRSPHRRR